MRARPDWPSAVKRRVLTTAPSATWESSGGSTVHSKRSKPSSGLVPASGSAATRTLAPGRNAAPLPKNESGTAKEIVSVVGAHSRAPSARTTSSASSSAALEVLTWSVVLPSARPCNTIGYTRSEALTICGSSTVADVSELMPGPRTHASARAPSAMGRSKPIADVVLSAG